MKTVLEKLAGDTGAPDAAPGAGDLARMVAVVRALLDSRRPCLPEACEEVAALEGALRLLTEHLHRARPEGAHALSPLQEAARWAVPHEFAVPESHRAARLGKVVTATKRAFIEGLQPFHVESLRPQADFNKAVVRVLEYLTVHRALGLGEDLSAWARAQLEPKADPTRWKVQRSHRAGALGSLVQAAKRSYLSAAGSLLEGLLRGQAEWNAAMVEAVVAASGPRAPDEATGAKWVASLCERNDPLRPEAMSRTLRAGAPLWTELLRRQTRFNEQAVLALAGVLGTRTPPPRPPELGDYEGWCARREPADIGAAREALSSLTARPRVSLITPVSDTPESVFRECADSVRAQVYPDWEWVLVDDASTAPHVAAMLREAAAQDARIQVVSLERDGGPARATNAGLAVATGEWVGFLDPDAMLAPHALAEVVLATSAEPSLGVVYSDEDGLDTEGRRTSPFFKPDWSPDLLRSVNYVRHFLVARKSLLEAVGGVREGFDDSWDFDLMLRLSEATSGIGHVAKVLYHGRSRPLSSSGEAVGLAQVTDAGERALREHLERRSESAEVTSPAPAQYRVRYPVRGTPKVSIIVPFKDRPDLLELLVPGLLSRTTYPYFEVLLVSNNSTKPETFALLERLTDPRLVKLTWDFPFNYPAINNWAAKQATGELLLFLNNDMEVVDPGWLEELVSQAQRPEVGAVGCKLLFPEGTVQHAGAVVGITGMAGHPFWRLPDGPISTPFGHTDWTRNWLSVTSACVIFRRDVFEGLEGFDERFQVCGSDVDIGLRLNQRGLRVVYTPHARLIHHESASRRADAVPESDYWRSYVSYRPWLGEKGDPFYNPNLSLLGTDCTLRQHAETGETLALRTLTHDVPSAQDAAMEARALAQRHLVEHLGELDFTPEQAEESRATAPAALAALRSRGKVRTASWFIPAFGHVYAGIHTLFRFAELMHRRHGVRSDFIVYDKPGASPGDFEARAATVFPEAAGAFRVLSGAADLDQLPACDMAIATYWTSVYQVLRHPRAGVRTYFVQDYEPMFFAAGTQSALAEQTYQLGFQGIFNTPGLRDTVRALHGMDGFAFEPAVDGALFHDRRPARRGPVRVFFYGRPGNERNGFELGLAALTRLKRELGPAVDIVTAGAEWHPESYGVRGLVTNLGVLPAERTAALYRECDVGLCFMFTRHPSYLPLEMMACGMTVVTNDNRANHWLLEDGSNCLLAAPTPGSVLARLRTAVMDGDLRVRLGSRAAERVRRTTWEQQVDQMMEHLLGLEVGPARSAAE
ncbi:glycosyltransferase [Myxococcus sp. CA039A]|uniref:rhamnosyltransferase WsaF family glycosyltransferase n=1 Tax=Myxococcus sp. CA039A TaxID=2741737 RepID=UPI00359C6680